MIKEKRQKILKEAEREAERANHDWEEQGWLVSTAVVSCFRIFSYSVICNVALCPFKEEFVDI